MELLSGASLWHEWQFVTLLLPLLNSLCPVLSAALTVYQSVCWQSWFFFFRDDILILQLCFCRLFFGCSPIWANMTVWERTESFLFVCFWIVIWMNNILFAWIMSDELNYQLCWSIRINEKHFPLLLRCEQGKWMFEKKTIIKLSLCQKENFFFLIRIVQMLVDILSLSLSLSTFGCIWIILIRQIYALEMDA